MSGIVRMWTWAVRGQGMTVSNSSVTRQSRDRGYVSSLYDPASSIAKKEMRVFHGPVVKCHQNVRFSLWYTSEKLRCWPHSICLLLQTESLRVCHFCSTTKTFILQWWSAEDFHTKTALQAASRTCCLNVIHHSFIWIVPGRCPRKGLGSKVSDPARDPQVFNTL